MEISLLYHTPLFSGKLEDLAHKVAEKAATELSTLKDDGSLGMSEVRMIMQAWLHLATFNLFDSGRVRDLIFVFTPFRTPSSKGKIWMLKNATCPETGDG